MHPEDELPPLKRALLACLRWVDSIRNVPLRVLFLTFLALAVAGIVQLARADTTIEALGAHVAAHAALSGHPHTVHRVESLDRRMVAVDGDIKRLQADVAKVLKLLETALEQRAIEDAKIRASISTLETWRSALAAALGTLGALLIGLFLRGKIRVSWAVDAGQKPSSS